MKVLDRGHAEMAKWLRINGRKKGVPPKLRREANRVAKNADAMARYNARKAQKPS